jgi:hypothetical protein
MSRMRHTQGKKWEYNERVYQLLAGLNNAYDSVTKGILYSIPTGFIVPRKF